MENSYCTIGFSDNTEISPKVVLKKINVYSALPKNHFGICSKLWQKGLSIRVKYDEGILLDLKMLVDQKQISSNRPLGYTKRFVFIMRLWKRTSTKLS